MSKQSPLRVLKKAVEYAGLTIVPMIGLTAVLMTLFNHLDVLGFLLAKFVIVPIVGAGTIPGFVRWLNHRDAPRVNRGPVYWFIDEFTLFYRGDPLFARRMILLIISLCAAALLLAVLGVWWIRGPVFSRGTLGSLRGKTREEVRQILGEPTEVEGNSWQYDHPRNSGRVYIEFYEDGSVRGVDDYPSLPVDIFGSGSWWDQTVKPRAKTPDSPP